MSKRLGNTVDPAALPAWLGEADLDEQLLGPLPARPRRHPGEHLRLVLVDRDPAIGLGQRHAAHLGSVAGDDRLSDLVHAASLALLNDRSC